MPGAWPSANIPAGWNFSRRPFWALHFVSCFTSVDFWRSYGGENVAVEILLRDPSHQAIQCVAFVLESVYEESAAPGTPRLFS